MRTSKEILDSLNQAWLVSWGFHGPAENQKLKEYGINRKVVDIVSVRKKLGNLIDIGQDIYRQTLLYPAEKIFLAHYNKGEKRRREFFKTSAPVFTQYQSDLYRNLMQSGEMNGLHHPKTRELRDRWKSTPQYIVIGHNPYLEIRRVYNLAVYRNTNGGQILEWDDKLADGTTERRKYHFKAI